MDLANKRIVVLGGTSGIGFAVAQKAADQGAAIVVASSKEDSVNRAKRILRSRRLGAPDCDCRRSQEGTGIGRSGAIEATYPSRPPAAT
jgi:NAD(P)-dependent dehydrogenase (short-subunit alcohol dehydrogenase family)